jgi:hypothetical protein
MKVEKSKSARIGISSRSNRIGLELRNRTVWQLIRRAQFFALTCLGLLCNGMKFPPGKTRSRLQWPRLGNHAISPSDGVHSAPLNGGCSKEHATLNKLFDADWYLKRYPDVAKAGLSPLTHYIECGATAGYNPHPMFSSAWYLDRYPDIADAGMNPLIHYAAHGAFEGRDPHPLFDTIWYLQRYPEVAAAGTNPLLHYIEHGVVAGHQPGPLFSGPEDWEMDYRAAVTMRATYDWEVDRPVSATALTKGAIGRLFAMTLAQWGKLCYSRSHFFLASIALRSALALTVTWRDEMLGLLTKCNVRQRRFDEAYDRFVCRTALPPLPPSTIETAHMPKISRCGTPHRTIGVVTSVMPRRIEAQRSALQSWRAAGLSVVSVNSRSEAAALREHFPDLTFRVIERPVEERGRPFVPIQALIQTVKELSEDICGIINSDVQFRGDARFFDMLCREVDGSLVFGNRIDIMDTGSTNGKAFRNGYDFFFWDRANSSLFEDTPMVLGMPWWDFWLPLHAYAQGLATKRFVTSAMIHVAHPIGWDILNYVKFGQLCAATLASAYGRWSDQRVPADRLFLHRLFATAATIPVNNYPHAALRRVGALCDLINCLIDDLSETVTLQDALLARGTLDLV